MLNNLDAELLRSLRSNSGLASQLAFFQTIAKDWRYLLAARDRIAKVTPKDVQRVASQYLVKSNRTVAVLAKRQLPPALVHGARAIHGIAHHGAMMMFTHRPRLSIIRVLCLVACAAVLSGEPLVVAGQRGDTSETSALDPRQMTFPPVEFNPPEPERRVLDNGMVVYTQDHELPLVTMSATMRAGGWAGSAGQDRARGSDRRGHAHRRNDIHPGGGL